MGKENENELKWGTTEGQAYLRHLGRITATDVEILLEKEEGYKGSWKKRGGVGAFMMLARKWDRIEAFLNTKESRWNIFKALWKDTRTETILEDVADLRRYLALVEAEFKEQTIRNDLAEKAHRDMNPEDYCCTNGECIEPEDQIENPARLGLTEKERDEVLADVVCNCCQHTHLGCFCPSYSYCPGHGDECTSQWKKERTIDKVKNSLK